MIEHIAVIVPVANEGALLEACLRHLAEARAYLRAQSPGVTVQVVTVLDGCHDASEVIARRCADVEVVTVDVRRVGSARRAGVAHVLATSPAANRTWLANTDADSTVPHNWLTGMLWHADRGADLVLGTVDLAPGSPSDVGRAWRRFHPAVEGHPYVHGANFGIRAAVYTELGGWPETVSGEDVLLAARAAESGELHIVRSAATPVITSARLVARAPAGFATYLTDLHTAHRTQHVQKDRLK